MSEPVLTNPLPAAPAAPPVAPPPAPVDTSALRREVQIRSMNLDAAITTKLVELGHAEAWAPADVGTHVAGLMRPAAAAPGAAAHQGRSDTGAPGASPGAIIPDNPLQWSRDQSWALFHKDPGELRRRVEAWAFKGSMTNAYAARRR